MTAFSSALMTGPCIRRFHCSAKGDKKQGWQDGAKAGVATQNPDKSRACLGLVLGLGLTPNSRHDRANEDTKDGGLMTDLRYEAPATLQAAVALLACATGPARVLAGGTDVIVQMETDLIEPALLVDIKKIPEVRQITAENGGFRIGAAATGMEIMDHAALCKAWPGVLDGVKLIGSIQVRGRASIGGNLCNGSPAADSVPPLIAAGAIARIIGSKGTREIPVEQIPASPGKTSLAKDELIVSF